MDEVIPHEGQGIPVTFFIRQTDNPGDIWVKATNALNINHAYPAKDNPNIKEYSLFRDMVKRSIQESL